MSYNRSHHRQTSSIISHPYSIASSNRHLNDNAQLEPMSGPFSSTGNLDSTVTSRSRVALPLQFNGLAGPESNAGGNTPMSLSVNYLPSKFSRPLSPNSGIYKRKNAKGGPTTALPKQGGGREAFKSGEARMPGENDEDYDGVNGGIFGGKNRRSLRWNKFKIIIFVMNLCVSNVRSFLDSPTDSRGLH